MKNKFTLLTAALLAASFLLTGCTGDSATTSSATSSEPASSAASTGSDSTSTPAEKATVRVATLSGPTGIGMAQLFEKDEAGESGNNYEFTIVSDPTEIVGLIANGSVDVAAIPTNLAANLYKKTSGGVRLAAVNTLGVLHILDATGTIQSVSDLRGKTIYATGEGSTPEYVLNYVLAQNGLTVGTDVEVVYKSEHSELATLCINGTAEIAMLPEPFVTNVMSKTDAFTKAIDLSKAWAEAADDVSLPMGGIVVTKDFAESKADALDIFMSEYEASVKFVNDDPAAAGQLVEKYGILPSAAVAESAIPNCNIVFITGTDMKDAVVAYYNVLLTADATSIGGSLPEDALYYLG